MKKYAIVIAGAAALFALPAVAGINPLDPGLPQIWTGGAIGYTGIVIGGSGTVDGSAATTKLSVVDSWSSAMCVECHGRNPSDKVTAPAQSGLVIAKTTHMGSHAVMSTPGSTNTGGGFTGGFGATQPRVAGQYEKTSLWVVAGQAGKGLSKYGSAANYQMNDILNGATTTTAGGMICESCHNILVNRGDQLLLGGYDNAGATVTVGDAKAGDQICVGCHATGGGAETYAGFHANGNLKNFNGASLKRHHVLDGDTVQAARYNTVSGTNSSTMWAPTFSYELGTGLYNTWAKTLQVPDDGTAAYAFRGLVNVTGAGTYAAAETTGDIATTTELMCVSCHRPHNAETNTGAFILRRGTATPFNGNAGTTAADGLKRQSDYDTTYASKIYGEYLPLCKGCHQGYGN